MSNTEETIESEWTRRLRDGSRPVDDDLVAHLQAVHRAHPGFTESCAWRCRNHRGLNSYEWLAGLAASPTPTRVLDLACGSGVLTELLLRQASSGSEIVGVDMSPDELALARARVPRAEQSVEVWFEEAMAQAMPFLPDDSVDVVLCHWALTLVSPLEPVLREVARLLKPGGVFGAIVDGDSAAAPGYEELSDTIYGWARRACPGYGTVDLGDPRVRSATALEPLMHRFFINAKVTVESDVMRLVGAPAELAEAAIGFFYASYVVAQSDQPDMYRAVQRFFAERRSIDRVG
ncbi:MAG: class I SAM-dependent methyltransferase, partial [Myxococcota bacterium]